MRRNDELERELFSIQDKSSISNKQHHTNEDDSYTAHKQAARYEIDQLQEEKLQIQMMLVQEEQKVVEMDRKI